MCQVVYHSQPWAQDPWTSPDSYIPLPTRGNLIILSNSHLWATCPLIGIESYSGTSVLEHVQSPSYKKWETEPWGVWLTLAAGKFMKTWDLGILVPRLGDFQEKKDERKLHCIHFWVALRCLQAPEWKFLSSCPSSLVPISSADLPPCSSRKAIFRAVSSGFQAQWESPSCSDPRRLSYRWWLTYSQLRSSELPLLIHTRQILGWLGNMNLHSQREAFSSQPSGYVPYVSSGNHWLSKVRVWG